MEMFKDIENISGTKETSYGAYKRHQEDNIIPYNPNEGLELFSTHKTDLQRKV